MTDKAKDHLPEPTPQNAAEPVSSPYDEPTLELRRPRSSMLESDDDLDLDNSAFDRPAQYGYDGSGVAPTEQLYRYEPGGATAAAVGVEEGGSTGPAKARRGSLDLGLLVLRLVVGATMVVHGLQKLTGLWGGPGMDGFEAMLADAGYQSPALLAVLGAVGEVAAGALLILGLLTPLAAAAVLAIMINAWLFRQSAEPGLQYFAPDGVEYETLLAATAAVIVLTGPGRIAIDGTRGWATRPFLGSFVALLLGVAGGVCLWLFGR
ncbi:DoxX family protein [Rhodococcus rhodochrous]|uniref:DoxX protein n=1 Tax=Rhodococcus rhodochrous KG-21 TaxID=1441923 RepID=A0A0M8PM88_RHORH|nr:DoxX family protein [Rhodococcus rhodochrous]KOS55069.1 DoxX protein [Rhodococcus rhodochrous KG-21]